MPLLSQSPTAINRWLLFSGLILGGIFLDLPGNLADAGQGVKKPPAPAAQSTPVQAAPKPSLDTLKSRVNAFWNLLMRGQKSEALQYVELSGRKNLEAWQLVQISEPRITTLAFTSKAEEMSVTVEIKRTFPPLPAAFSWPVTQNWVFRNGNWFVRVEQASATVLFPTSPGKPNQNLLSPEETERRQNQIRAALQFETSTLEFGRANRDDVLSLTIGYKLAGSEPFGIFLRNFPEDFSVRNIANRTLPVGNEQKIQMEFLTRSYAGEVNEKFTAVISHQNVEVPYDFKIHGYVYVPVYASPGTLAFRNGERVKEVVIRNDSKSEVVINKIASKDFDVTPLPQKLPPGGSCTLKVSVLQDTADKNHADSISLSFNKPVEEMGGLDLSIIRNYEVIDPEKARELQLKELLRQSGIPIKK